MSVRNTGAAPIPEPSSRLTACRWVDVLSMFGDAAGLRPRAGDACRPNKWGGGDGLAQPRRDGGLQAWRVHPHHWTQASAFARSRRSQPVRALAALAHLRPAKDVPCSVQEPVERLSEFGRAGAMREARGQVVSPGCRTRETWGYRATALGHPSLGSNHFQWC